MKIFLLTSIAGERFSHRPGKIVDWKPDSEAKRYVKAEAARIPTAAEIALFDEQEKEKVAAAKKAAAQAKKDAAKVKAANTKRTKTKTAKEKADAEKAAAEEKAAADEAAAAEKAAAEGAGD